MSGLRAAFLYGRGVSRRPPERKRPHRYPPLVHQRRDQVYRAGIELVPRQIRGDLFFDDYHAMLRYLARHRYVGNVICKRYRYFKGRIQTIVKLTQGVAVLNLPVDGRCFRIKISNTVKPDQKRFLFFGFTLNGLGQLFQRTVGIEGKHQRDVEVIRLYSGSYCSRRGATILLRAGGRKITAAYLMRRRSFRPSPYANKSSMFMRKPGCGYLKNNISIRRFFARPSAV